MSAERQSTTFDCRPYFIGGQRIFMLENQMHEFRSGDPTRNVPEWCEILPSVHGMEHLECSYQYVHVKCMCLCLMSNLLLLLCRKLSERLEELQGVKLSHKFKVDAMMFLEFTICLADSPKIPLEHFFNGKALLATANCRAVRRLLQTPAKRKIMEDVINEDGLEHLGFIRFLSAKTGRFVDMCGWDPDYVVPR